MLTIFTLNSEKNKNIIFKKHLIQDLLLEIVNKK